MRNQNNLPTRPTLRGLVLALAVTALSSYVAQAVPYASQITRSGDTVSFILNQDAQGLVVLRDGANPVYPGTTAGTLSFDMNGYTSYQIIVTGDTAVGWSKYVPDGVDRNFYYPRGLAIDKHAASTNFGKVYVCEAWGGTTGAGRTTSDGIYVLQADGVAEGGVKTGGVDWTLDGSYASAPHKCSIGDDDHLYVSRYYDDLAFEFNADLSVATQLIDAGNKTTGQYVEAILETGTQAGGDRKIYLVDSHYLDARRGLIQYDLGANATAIGLGTGTQWIGPDYFNFYPRDVKLDSSGNWYMNNYRAFTDQAPAISKFDGSLTPPINTAIWDTTMDYLYTWALGLNEADGTVATADHSTGVVYLFDMATGAFVESFNAGGSIRDVAFDVAGNMVTSSSSQEYVRFWSPGGYSEATTRSDGTFTLVRPTIKVSVTASPDTTSMNTSLPPGVFSLTRTGDTSSALAVSYTLTGTATNGVQYNLLSGTATFQAGFNMTDVQVTAIPYSPAGPTRSVILTINTSNTYSPTAPFTATVWIVDTNKPAIHIAARDAQFYERTNDFGRFTLTRWGDTNTYITQVNVTYGGTATEGTQFYGDANTFMSYGEQTKDVQVYPIHDGLVTGPLTVTATVAPATYDDYTVGTPATSGGITRVDADDPPETVLWSDGFSTDSSANWTVRFATTNGAPADYCLNALPDFASLPQIGTWPFDYSVLGIPSAPHTTDGSTRGLYMAVNKNDTQLAAGALNLYPNGQSFSGNYALRFDMYLIRNDTSAQTEYALFGINHDGTHTNWFRGSTSGFTGVNPTAWNFDGIFYVAEADASGTDDYLGFSSPTATDRNPTQVAPGVGASALRSIFRAPPWTVGGVGGGSPANVYGSPTPIWADVEVAQINGVVYWSINHTLIFAYTNATPYTSGNIMLGYEDGYDSIGSSGGSVIYANARVVSLAGPYITEIVLNGANAEITFTANPSDVVSQFVLQSASTADGTYADTDSTITSLGGGSFKAVKAASGSPTFYRIRRIY